MISGTTVKKFQNDPRLVDSYTNTRSTVRNCCIVYTWLLAATVTVFLGLYFGNLEGYLTLLISGRSIGGNSLDDTDLARLEADEQEALSSPTHFWDILAEVSGL
jgi:hypothetical protein